MANNNLIYDAAVAGATGGAAQRWLTKQNSTDYNGLAAQIILFATSIDTEIGADPTITQQDAELMAAICSQVLASRWPNATSVLGSQNIALAIKAIWTRLRGEMIPIAPGALLNNLGNVWYADAGTTVPTAQQTGNIEAPFATIAQAITAAAALDTIICAGPFTANLAIAKNIKLAAIAEGTLFTLTGTITMTGAIAVSIDGGQISGAVAIGAGGVLHASRSIFGAAITGAGSFDADTCALAEFSVANATMKNCSVAGDATITGGGIQTWESCTVTGNATVADFTGINCSVVGNLIGSGPTFLHACSVGGNVSGIIQLVMDECTIVGTTACSVLTSAVDCELTGALTIARLDYANGCTFGVISITGANPNRMVGCKYTSLAGVGGSTIDCDSFSASWAAVTGGLVRTIDSPRATVSVVVPVLLAAAIGTATAVLTGTVLAGLTTASQVVGSEPTAGVTGGGFLASTRISATNTALFTFLGPTTGGAQNFVVTQV